MIVFTKSHSARKLSPAGRIALKAINDCGAISARWTNPGFEELRILGLVTYRRLEAGMYLHKRRKKPEGGTHFIPEENETCNNF